jgi:hypothetical protein
MRTVNEGMMHTPDSAMSNRCQFGNELTQWQALYS